MFLYSVETKLMKNEVEKIKDLNHGNILRFYNCFDIRNNKALKLAGISRFLYFIKILEKKLGV